MFPSDFFLAALLERSRELRDLRVADLDQLARVARADRDVVVEAIVTLIVVLDDVDALGEKRLEVLAEPRHALEAVNITSGEVLLVDALVREVCDDQVQEQRERAVG